MSYFFFDTQLTHIHIKEKEMLSMWYIFNRYPANVPEKRLKKEAKRIEQKTITSTNHIYVKNVPHS